MRLKADAAHGFGGIALDRDKPFAFRLDGRRVAAFSGDTVLSAVLAAGVTGWGTLGGAAMGLGPGFAPLLATRRGGAILPMERTPALPGLDLTLVGHRRRFGLRQAHTFGRLLDALPERPWLRAEPEETVTADVLVIGGGVAGLSAAAAAGAAGHRVIVAERRPWLGGDARYFGPVGDEASPAALTERLIADLGSRPEVRLLTSAEVFRIGESGARLHLVDAVESRVRARVLDIAAPRIVLATGALQRLAVFPGNRLPGVIAAIDAYHLGKRYGVSLGPSAVVATQSNHAYRLALRLHDAGVPVRRIVDTRIHPQSRFVDFAKASGLTLGSGQMPLAARRGRYSFAPVAGSGGSVDIEAGQCVVAGGWQPELTLWMLAGGRVAWSEARNALLALGGVEHLALAGAAAGYHTLRACAASGRMALALLFGGEPGEIEDVEPGPDLETAAAPTPIAAAAGASLPAFLDGGRTLVQRPAVGQFAPVSPRALSLGDVAALVALGEVAPDDAGAIAEERGAPGADLTASGWTPPPPLGAPEESLPPYLVKRFGDAPQRLHLIVDGRRRFPVGTLVYANATAERVPEQAVGVVVEEASPGGIALVGRAARRLDRFIVETATGPSPARPKPRA